MAYNCETGSPELPSDRERLVPPSRQQNIFSAEVKKDGDIAHMTAPPTNRSATSESGLLVARKTADEDPRSPAEFVLYRVK
jgi:hypothetical protein